jgi:protein gp37
MENSKIEWCDHTFNSWEGCAKISPGCKNCYAEAQHRLWHSALNEGDNPGTCWGINAPRLARSEANWAKPRKWNAAAAAQGERRRVFCSSMADVFEVQSAKSLSYAGTTGTVPVGEGKTRTVRFVAIAAERYRLLKLIYETPNLDWLLLTKRPENILPALMAAYSMIERRGLFAHWLEKWIAGTPPTNVWLGTSVENQEQADIRVPQLLAAPAAVRFLSCEPLLGPVNLWRVDHDERTLTGPGVVKRDGTTPNTSSGPGEGYEDSQVGIDWVIVGGESGHHARPMHPDWARDIQLQCEEAGVPFLFKQWGNWTEQFSEAGTGGSPRKGDIFLGPDGKIVSYGQVPDDRVYFEFGDGCEATVARMRNVGKEAAGRLLEGKTYDQWPTARITQ